MHEMGEIGHLHVTLPWPVHEYERLQGDGRGLLALRRAREQAAAGNADALFVRAGPVGAAGAARGDVREVDL